MGKGAAGVRAGRRRGDGEDPAGLFAAMNRSKTKMKKVEGGGWVDRPRCLRMPSRRWSRSVGERAEDAG
jgi:hypothetical protein